MLALRMEIILQLCFVFVCHCDIFFIMSQLRYLFVWCSYFFMMLELLSTLVHSNEVWKNVTFMFPFCSSL